MFESLRIHGSAASILWGYRPAATLRSWSIVRGTTGWTLTGTVERADAFQCRQRPLLFTAPRDNGMWAWGIEELTVVGQELKARLGPPEQ